MMPGLQTHIRGGIDPAVLREVRALGFERARIDGQRCSPEDVNRWVRDVQQAGLAPLVTLWDAAQISALDPTLGPLDIELRNEPNLEGPDPMIYRGLLAYVLPAVVAGGHRLWAPAISNLDRKGFAYLRACGPLPAGVNVSVHWYPHGNRPERPHPGFESRYIEVSTLLNIIGEDRSWGVSEFGYHSAARRSTESWLEKQLGVTHRWSDEEVAAHVHHEWRFWREAGASFACLFQLNDGPEDNKEHRFGIRRLDGTWKPAAYSLQGL